MSEPTTTAENPVAFDFETFCRDRVVRESAPAKIALLRGPLFHDDSAWPALLAHRRDIERFFAEIGVRLRIDTTDGYAYLDQTAETEAGGDWPKLLHRDRFSYEMTCVLVVLREWLLTQETKTQEDRAPLRMEELLGQLRPFSRKKEANVEREEKRWREAINKVMAAGFLKRWRGEESFMVRPLVRSWLSIEHLQSLRTALEQHGSQRESASGEESS